mmetsp:Transcript_1288/g.3019  ORF Transcript_1288/g.3019 Transcript_1288/m.3019 type:complete len:108 (+) Transcript_1288:343-666(+)
MSERADPCEGAGRDRSDSVDSVSSNESSAHQRRELVARACSVDMNGGRARGRGAAGRAPAHSERRRGRGRDRGGRGRTGGRQPPPPAPAPATPATSGPTVSDGTFLT